MRANPGVREDGFKEHGRSARMRALRMRDRKWCMVRPAGGQGMASMHRAICKYHPLSYLRTFEPVAR